MQSSKLTPVAAPCLAMPIEQLAKATGIGRTTLYAEIKAGHLVAVKVRGRTIIRPADAEAWLASKVPA